MLEYKKHLITLLTFMAVVTTSIALGGQASKIQDLNAYTATTESVNQPNMPAISLLVWANEAAVTAYSYDFVHYRKELQTASQYFTPEGWKKFKEALDKSGNLDTVISKKLVVSAVATGVPVILEQGVNTGKYFWKVEMPMLVTYQNNSFIKNQNLVATMLVVRTPKNIGTRGLGIEQFVVKIKPQIKN